MAERSLMDITMELRKKGFGLNFAVQQNDTLKTDTGIVFEPEELQVKEVHRLEGESNPDDMCVVFGLESVKDNSVKGVFIVAFGPMMTGSQASIAKRLIGERDTLPHA